MPEQIDNILGNLKDHGETPPEFLLGKILHVFETEQQQDNRLCVLVSGLKDFAVEPGSSLFNGIEKRLRPATVKPIRRPALLAVLARYRVAAAVAFVFIAGWLIYKSNLFEPAKEEELATKPVPSTLPGVKDNNEIIVPQTDSGRAAKKGGYADNHFSKKIFSNSFGYEGSVKPPGENTVKMEDNDLFYTLINCDYKVLEPYLKEDGRKMLVTVDQYSSVTVTPKMIEFMKQMYKKKRRDKPTAKARRAKATLEKWKKTDAKYFEEDKSKTALDIMDLGEYVIEKK